MSEKVAVRNVRLCEKDCLCLYVCPTGASDTENSVIDTEKCIGCGACQAIEPSVFELEDDGLAKAIDNEINNDVKENVIDALEGCPTSAISEIQ